MAKCFSICRYAFVEYKSPEEALAAVKSVNNYKLDKSHTLKVNLFTDFEKYKDIPEDWKEPERRPFPQNVNESYSHLYNRECYDQFSILSSSTTETSVQVWLNSRPEPMLLEDRKVNSFTQCHLFYIRLKF